MPSVTLTLGNLVEFERRFFGGEFPHQRYGQAFMDYFALTETEKERAKMENLFYEEDTGNCARIAYYILMDWED